MLKAVTRSAQGVDKRLAAINRERASNGQTNLTVANYFDHHATDLDTEVSVTETDFTKAKEELAPSVSMDELRHYERVRDAFEGAAKKSSNGETAGAQNGSHIRDRESSRPKLSDVMKRASANKDSRSTVNGNGRSKSNISQAIKGASDEDDDYVIRTDRMTLNNAGARPPSSKGKGKGKGTATSIDNDAANKAEDLYD